MGFINRFTRLPNSTGGGHVKLVSNKAEAMPTTSLGFALAFFVAAFVSTLVGLAFRAYLADRLLLDHARDLVGDVTGLVVTLVALVLGLLIWTAVAGRCLCYGVAMGPRAKAATLIRRRPRYPTPTKPRSIIAQVDGSGVAAAAVVKLPSVRTSKSVPVSTPSTVVSTRSLKSSSQL